MGIDGIDGIDGWMGVDGMDRSASMGGISFFLLFFRRALRLFDYAFLVFCVVHVYKKFFFFYCFPTKEVLQVPKSL